MVQKKTILIVDDHTLFREGLRSIIERGPGYEVIGEAGNAREGLKMVEKYKPDLVLLDISLPDRSGIELICDIVKLSTKTRVMIVSMHSKTDYIVKAFQAGATGYVIKESAASKLLQGIGSVLKGDYFMDAAVSQKVVKKLAEIEEKKVKVTNTTYDALTPREQEVMILVAEGLSTNQISERLFISPKTVENHRSRIMQKLNLRSTIELARYATKLGLIDIDLWKD